MWSQYWMGYWKICLVIGSTIFCQLVLYNNQISRKTANTRRQIESKPEMVFFSQKEVPLNERLVEHLSIPASASLKCSEWGWESYDHIGFSYVFQSQTNLSFTRRVNCQSAGTIFPNCVLFIIPSLPAAFNWWLF